MALTFPNHSRSYDRGKQSIRFTGYDGVFEISVFVEGRYSPGDDKRAAFRRDTLSGSIRWPASCNRAAYQQDLFAQTQGHGRAHESRY